MLPARPARLAPLALAAALVPGCAGRRPGGRPPPSDAVPELRLPGDVRPVAYRLEITAVPERERFEGRVEIDVRLDRPSPLVWLHARGLDVTRAAVLASGAEVPARFGQVTPEGVARLVPERPLAAGAATLVLAFSGQWDEHLAGFYRVRWGGGVYAYTMFEAVKARRAFPCFDEPAFKVPFDIALVVKEGDVAVSNGPVAGEEPAGAGLKRVRFARTAPLPTYLVFLAAGPFDVVAPPPLPPNEVRSRPLPVRGLAPQGEGPRLALALAAQARILPALERWFGIAFPYDKLDHLASPDFAFGGMENAGAILYADRYLLVSPGDGPARHLALAKVVAHEIAHQWFGDLVTLEWWDDVWLNESFATFIAPRAVEAWLGDPLPALDAVAAVEAVMDADGLAASRAVRQPLRHPGQIERQFDRLSYDKGAAVLRATERLMGEERFRDAIRGWLRAHAHGTATTESLLGALSTAAGRDLGPALRGFLDRPGVPLVEAGAVCGGEGARIDLFQSRWLPLGSRAARNVQWQLPVCARYRAGGKDGEACTLLDGVRGAIALPACPEWYALRARGDGYYRYVLQPEDLEALRARGLGKLAPAEKLALARSLWAAARAGEVPVGAALEALAPLAADPASPVAAVPREALEESVEHLVGEAGAARGRALAASLFQRRLVELGWAAGPDEPVDRARLRAVSAEAAVRLGRDPAARREAAARGRAWAGLDGKADPGAIAPEVAALALATAVEEGGAATFAALEERLVAERDGARRREILEALGSVEAPVLSARALALAGDSRLRRNERLATLQAQASRAGTRATAWLFVRERFESLAPALPAGWADSLPRLASGFCDLARAGEVRDFFAPRAERSPGMRRTLDQAIESIELCAAFREGQGASAEGFLARR